MVMSLLFVSSTFRLRTTVGGSVRALEDKQQYYGWKLTFKTHTIDLLVVQKFLLNTWSPAQGIAY